MTSPVRVSRCRMVLVALAMCLVLLTGGCAPRATPPEQPPESTPPPPAVTVPPAPAVQSPEPAVEPPELAAPGQPADYCYPPHVFHVGGPGAHRLAENQGRWGWWGEGGRWDYWFVDADPVTIEIRFAEAVPYPADAVRQVREALESAEAVIHEEGYAADRVFVRASLPPGRHFVWLRAIQVSQPPLFTHPGLILHRGRPFRLMYWEPGGTAEVLGDYILPSMPFPAGAEAEWEKAVFGTIFLEPLDMFASFSLWYWQPDAQPSLRPMPGIWSGLISAEMVSLRRDDLVIQSCNSVFVVDSRGQLIATLVEDREQIGMAVGPEGEIAVFLLQRDDQRALHLDLTIFSATLGDQQTWEAIYRHGTYGDWWPSVEPVWHGDEILFLALDDRQPDRRTYNLMAFDVLAGSVRRLAGPFAHARRLGLSHYALHEHDGPSWTLFDATTASLRILPSAAELGLPPAHWAPMAVNGEWIVFRWDWELLAWHPTAGVTRLGPGESVFAMGDGFAWWTETGERP